MRVCRVTIAAPGSARSSAALGVVAGAAMAIVVAGAWAVGGSKPRPRPRLGGCRWVFSCTGGGVAAGGARAGEPAQRQTSGRNRPRGRLCARCVEPAAQARARSRLASLARSRTHATCPDRASRRRRHRRGGGASGVRRSELLHPLVSQADRVDPVSLASAMRSADAVETRSSGRRSGFNKEFEHEIRRERLY